MKQSDEIIQEEVITEMPHDALSGSIDDLPPKLELEGRKSTRPRIYDEQGNDITNTPEVQQLIARGEIPFQDGDEIILVDQVRLLRRGRRLTRTVRFPSGVLFPNCFV